MNTIFEVVPQNAMGYGIILGMQFLRKNKIIIDMGKRVVKRQFPDGSCVLLYVSRENRVEQIRHENVPVYAAENAVIDRDKPAVRVAVAWSKSFNSLGQDTAKELYIEGLNKENRVRGLDGIVTVDQEKTRVLLDNYTSRKSIRVKTGEKVGKVSTLVELVPNEHELKEWSEEELRENIALGDHLGERERDLVYHMLKDTVRLWYIHML